MPVEPRRRTGRHTPAGIFEESGPDPDAATALPSRRGIEGEPGERPRDMARRNGVDPHEIPDVPQDRPASGSEEGR